MISKTITNYRSSKYMSESGSEYIVKRADGKIKMRPLLHGLGSGLYGFITMSEEHQDSHYMNNSISFDIKIEKGYLITQKIFTVINVYEYKDEENGICLEEETEKINHAVLFAIVSHTLDTYCKSILNQTPLQEGTRTITELEKLFSLLEFNENKKFEDAISLFINYYKNSLPGTILVRPITCFLRSLGYDGICNEQYDNASNGSVYFGKDINPRVLFCDK